MAGWNGASKPFSLSRSVLRISLFQNRSQRGRLASAMIRFVRPTVLVLSTSNLGKTRTPLCSRVGFQDRLGKLPVERRVDNNRVVRDRARNPSTTHDERQRDRTDPKENRSMEHGEFLDQAIELSSYDNSRLVATDSPKAFINQPPSFLGINVDVSRIAAWLRKNVGCRVVPPPSRG